MTRRVTRRMFLRGAGATVLTLPLLPALSSRAETGEYPRRLVVWWVPEGVEPEYWWPAARRSQTDFDLSHGLDPLARHRADLSLTFGFRIDSAEEGDGHVTQTQALLTGGLYGPDRVVNGHPCPRGMSVDQLIAQHIQGDARYRSYQLGVVNGTTAGSGAKRTISFESATRPRNATSNPVRAYDDLVATALVSDGAGVEERRRRLARRASILDGLRDEVRALRCDVGSDGLPKLDAYLDSIRTIERRLDDALLDPDAGRHIPEVVVDRAYDDSDIWSDARRFPELGQIQMEILVAALAADSTRVASLSWATSVSRVRYRWLPINFPDRVKHQLSHPHVDEYGLDVPRARRDNGDIFRWHEEQLATFIDMLKAVPEGDETLFDHTLILRCSEMGFGNHGRSNIPFLLAGSACGAFRTGRYFDLAGPRGDAFRGGGYDLSGGREGYERTHNDVLTAIAQGFGLDLAEIGRPEDNTGAYTEILS